MPEILANNIVIINRIEIKTTTTMDALHVVSELVNWSKGEFTQYQEYYNN